MKREQNNPIVDSRSVDAFNTNEPIEDERYFVNPKVQKHDEVPEYFKEVRPDAFMSRTRPYKELEMFEREWPRDMEQVPVHPELR